MTAYPDIQKKVQEEIDKVVGKCLFFFRNLNFNNNTVELQWLEH